MDFIGRADLLFARDWSALFCPSFGSSENCHHLVDAGSSFVYFVFQFFLLNARISPALNALLTFCTVDCSVLLSSEVCLEIGLARDAVGGNWLFIGCLELGKIFKCVVIVVPVVGSSLFWSSVASHLFYQFDQTRITALVNFQCFRPTFCLFPKSELLR